MTNEEAIGLARQAIIPCKGVTLVALTRVIELAEKYAGADGFPAHKTIGA